MRVWIAAGCILPGMEIKLIIPDEVVERIIAALDAKADQIAEERAKLIVDGNLWVNLKQAAEITGRTRASLRAALKTKQIAHYLNKGLPQFKIKDLWVWMDQTRQEAKALN